MVTRRNFLTRTGPQASAMRRKRPEESIEPVGVQLYTVRDRMAEDFEGTLATVAEIGYAEVEFAGLFGHDASSVRGMLDSVGLVAPSSHEDFGALLDNPGPVFDQATALGQTYVVVPFLDAARRTSLNDYRRIAEQFNEIGVQARSAGLRFGYHNHAFEFEPMDGRRPLDVLLESTDPTLVWFELDLFWAEKGGANALELFRAHPGRFPMVHVKDMDAAGDMVDVGAGELDFSLVFANARTAGLVHSFVEHDQPGDSLASIRSSFRYLSALQIRSEADHG